ncbi:MAG: DUF979 family protein [Deltaproteobacteria bacterium]|nr:MAG: DUF979 family protein [Deltaproteobacteria bacterium]
MADRRVARRGDRAQRARPALAAGGVLGDPGGGLPAGRSDPRREQGGDPVAGAGDGRRRDRARRAGGPDSPAADRRGRRADRRARGLRGAPAQLAVLPGARDPGDHVPPGARRADRRAPPHQRDRAQAAAADLARHRGDAGDHPGPGGHPRPSGARGHRGPAAARLDRLAGGAAALARDAGRRVRRDRRRQGDRGAGRRRHPDRQSAGVPGRVRPGHIGLPLLVKQHGAHAAALGAMGMLTGYCGTLVTPMAANFNIVPVLLLELRDPHAVIRAQWPTALALLVANLVLMSLLVF